MLSYNGAAEWSKCKGKAVEENKLRTRTIFNSYIIGIRCDNSCALVTINKGKEKGENRAYDVGSLFPPEISFGLSSWWTKSIVMILLFMVLSLLSYLLSWCVVTLSSCFFLCICFVSHLVIFACYYCLPETVSGHHATVMNYWIHRLR